MKNIIKTLGLTAILGGSLALSGCGDSDAPDTPTSKSLPAIRHTDEIEELKNYARDAYDWREIRDIITWGRNKEGKAFVRVADNKGDLVDYVSDGFNWGGYTREIKLEGFNLWRPGSSGNWVEDSCPEHRECPDHKRQFMYVGFGKSNQLYGGLDIVTTSPDSDDFKVVRPSRKGGILAEGNKLRLEERKIYVTKDSVETVVDLDEIGRGK